MRPARDTTDGMQRNIVTNRRGSGGDRTVLAGGRRAGGRRRRWSSAAARSRSTRRPGRWSRATSRPRPGRCSRTSARCSRPRARAFAARRATTIFLADMDDFAGSTRSTASSSSTIRRRARPCRPRSCRRMRGRDRRDRGDLRRPHVDAHRSIRCSTEKRSFAPPRGVRAQAPRQEHGRLRGACTRGRRDDPEGFWGEVAGELAWSKHVGPRARLEAARREVVRRRPAERQRRTASTGTSTTWRKNKAAIILEGEPGDTRVLTYGQLHREVCKAANALNALGVRQGDRVAIYMPMIPEAAIAMLACARIGAPHTVVFGGFSAEALARSHQGREGEARHHRRRRLAARHRSCRSRTTSTRRVEGADASRRCSSSSGASNDGRVARRARRLVARGRGRRRRRRHGRGVRQRAPAVHPLHHRHDRQAEGHPAHDRRLPDRRVATRRSWCSTCKDDDVYWCTADIGWVTGHSYVVYGPLANGATVLMYEGAPNQPEPDRFWEIIEKYRRDDFLHGADGDPRVHEVGRSVAGEARPVVPAAARLGRRADQPRGVDVVPRADRRRPLPDRRHLVADRDRRDHDLAAARRDADQARLARRGRCRGSRRMS